MAHDLANYLNEMVLDNSYPCGNGVALFMENEPQDCEIKALLTRYLRRYYETVLSKEKECESWDLYIEKALPQFELQVRKCRLLSSFYWAVWSFKILSKDQVCNDSVFNYDYANTHIKLFSKMRKEWSL